MIDQHMAVVFAPNGKVHVSLFYYIKQYK